MKEPLAITDFGRRIPGSADSAQPLWDEVYLGTGAICEIPSHRWSVAAHFRSRPASDGKRLLRTSLRSSMSEYWWRPVVARVFTLVAIAASVATSIHSARAQAPVPTAQSGANFTIDTVAVAPHRFIAVHGRRALIQGYAAEGLEVWAYPFQILSGYHIAFRPHGATAAINGENILSRVTYAPDSITRTYLGPNFIVRETLSVPINHPGAILSYSIDGANSIDVEVRATPVMDLMWPAGVGGQSYAWNPSMSAFVLSEPSTGYSATVGTPDIIAHDDPGNSTIHVEDRAEIAFTLRPGPDRVARLFINLNLPGEADREAQFRRLISGREQFESEAAIHFKEVTEKDLIIQTPDSDVNRAIAWAEIAIDQAWVCNPGIGCGYVAGYGPTRGARRPQYEWFFAGDGLVAAQGALSAGDFAQARAEMEFILRHQDHKTGMIWHEISQSAPFIDWGGKYPYMFVHVDTTFQFLGVLGQYVTVSGDKLFIDQHWNDIEGAFRYCLSVIDPKTALPRIPPDKEGGNEQDRMSDDLGLSTSWVTAADAFAQLATISGHNSLADEASRALQRARESIATHYWSTRNSFWISGHDLSGKEMLEQRNGPSEALDMHLFDPQQSRRILDQLASASFQTDWGTRGIGSESQGFDPESYAKGSVWPVGSAALAKTFWSAHRPVSGLSLWTGLVPLDSLDSLGHMPEVLAGNFYRPQIESVPEQTWSSAAFLDATVRGLLGLQSDAINKRLSFAPRLPANWDRITVKHIGLLHNSISLELHRTLNGFRLTIENKGEPFKFDFDPDLPLGAKILSAALNRRSIAFDTENYPQQTEARITVDVLPGTSELDLEWRGGVSIMPEVIRPLLGDSGSSIRFVDSLLEANTLTISADVPTDRDSHVRLQTEWKVAKAEGVIAHQLSDGLVDLTFPATRNSKLPYGRTSAKIEFAP